MEQMTRLADGRIFYGSHECRDIEDAYIMFRNDYNSSQGRRRNRKLNTMMSRKERMHGWGMFIDGVPEPPEELRDRKVPSRLLGIVATGYCRSIGSWDLPDLDEETLYDYLDWLCAHGNGNLRLLGRGDGSGRTTIKNR